MALLVSCRGLSLKVQTIFLSAVSAAFGSAGRSSKVRAGFKDSLSLSITGQGHHVLITKGQCCASCLSQVHCCCRCFCVDWVPAPSLLHRLQRQLRLNCWYRHRSLRYNTKMLLHKLWLLYHKGMEYALTISHAQLTSLIIFLPWQACWICYVRKLA